MQTRRQFISSCAMAGGAFFIPATKLFGQDLPKKQLRMAVVGAGGIGGMTRSELQRAGATVAALCDVNLNDLARVAKDFPGVPTYTDWRKLYEHAKDFDMVAISTPDHTHAIIALHAMRLGKHVYIQKPLAHSVEECEMLLKEQRRTGVVAQMGTQHHPRGRAFQALVDSGVIGDVTEVTCWTDRPGRFWQACPNAYPTQGEYARGFTKETWDIWLGPQIVNPCSSTIAPFRWRGWWHYGTGAIGDMAIHNADPAFYAYRWGLPTAVTGFCDEPVKAGFPAKAKIVIEFAPTAKSPKPVTFTWLNASQRPEKPAGCHPKYEFSDNGLLFKGTKGAFNGVVWQGNPLVIAADHAWNEDTKRLQREYAEKLKPMKFHDHYNQFVDAAKAGDPKACECGMEYAAPFTQSLLIGAIGLRFPGKKLLFDPVKRQFTNCPEANEFLRAPSRGAFSMKDFA